MRTLLTGELAQAQDSTSDYYVKLEIQNGSGTWVDVGAALGTHWLINVTFGVNVDQTVSQATFTLIDRIGSASLAPLMSTSPLNVDDHGAYAPLIDIGRLVRANIATMAHRVALDVSKYREAFMGRIDEVSNADSPDFSGPITLTCSDLGAWLNDIQIETPDVSYGSDAGIALETVLQSLLTDNIPATEPAVTLVKASASSFAVTAFKQSAVLLLEALTALVLGSTGEDLRYRYDASHVSQLTWFNPDRTRVTVDATFSANQYLLRTLGVAIANVRNAIQMPYTDAATSTSGTATSENLPSISKYRRRFNEIPASALITDLTSAQKVVDAIANDLSDAPAQVSADLPFFFWPVQLYDRYTFTANNRQYDQDQTFGVVGYQHTIQNGQGATSLTLAGRIVGAYAAWLARISTGSVDPATFSILRIESTETADGASRDFVLTVGYRVTVVYVHWRDVAIDETEDTHDFSDTAVLAEDPSSPQLYRPAGNLVTFSLPQPLRGRTVAARFVPYYSGVEGESVPFTIDAAPPSINVQLHATKVSGTTATLSVDITVGPSDIPASVAIIETISGVETTILTVAAISANVTLDSVGYPVLANRSIPNGVQSATWRAVLTDVGSNAWRFGPVTALSDVPSLTAEYKPLTSTTGQIIWTCTAGTVLVSIDGAAPGTPGASPIAITLDGSTHNYAFTASIGGQTVPAVVTVPALPSTASPIVYLYNSAQSTTADTITMQWTVTNTPSSPTYDLLWSNDHGATITTIAGVSTPYTHNKTGTGGHGYDIVAGGTITTLQYAIVVKSSGVTVAQSPWRDVDVDHA